VTGHDDAARAGVLAREGLRIGDERPDLQALLDAQSPGACAHEPLGRSAPDQSQRPRVAASRGGLQQREDALLAREAPDVEHMIAAVDRRLRHERLMQPEAQRDRCRAVSVLPRIAG